MPPPRWRFGARRSEQSPTSSLFESLDLGDSSVPAALVNSHGFSNRFFTHFSIWRRVWEYLICVVAFFPIIELTFIPLFDPDIEISGYTIFLVCDVIYFVDFYVFTHTIYFSRGVLIASPARVRRRVGFVHMLLRYIGAISLGWISCMQTGNWHLLFAVNKLFRIGRAIEALDTIQHSLVYASWVSMMFPLWLLLFGSIHIMASIFYLTGLIEQSWGDFSWISELDYAPSKFRMYVYCLYFIASTIWTIGSGPFTAPTTSERILLIITSIFGVTVNAYCVGMMVSFLIDPISSDFLVAFSSIWDYLKFKRIPQPLRTEVLNVFQQRWTAYGGSSEPREVFKFVPETVRDHMKLDITRACFMKISMMQMARDRLLVAFANAMKPFTACPGEVLVQQGTVEPILHLIREGAVRVWINGRYFAENNCDAGLGLGELELLVDIPREMSVVAATYVGGWMLMREDLVRTMQHQEGLREELRTICKFTFPGYVRPILELLE
jgi:hyperpolarization activated cyclic nucleotide-gated potassium channel 2